MKLFAKTGLVAAAFIVTYSTALAQPADTTVPSIKGMPIAESEAYHYDATKARIKGDDKEAEQLLQKAVQVNPKAAGAYYDLARLSIKENNADKATDYIKKALALDGDNKWYKSQYAEILAMGNKFVEAADAYAALAKQEKYNEEYLLKASYLYQKEGKYKEALELLDKLIAQTGDEELMLQKQSIYLKMNDLDGATNIVKTLIAKNPEEGRYIALLADLYDNNKQPEKALEVYKDAEKKFPDDPSIQIGLADHYRKAKNSAKYKEYLTKAVNNKGLDAETQLNLLIAHMQDGPEDSTQKQFAVELAAQVVTQHPVNPQVLAVYGDLLSINNEPKKAVEQYKKSLAVDPSRFALWQNLLYNLTGREDADSLIVYSEKAMRLFPNQAIVHYLNGIGYINKKDFNKAAKAINRAIDMQPEENTALLADMHSSLGDAYNSSKQYELSDESYDKALKLAPDNASVLNNYSYYLSVRNKRLDEAEKMSKRSLELRPDEGTFLDTYGWILYKQGKYDKAEEYIQKAVDKNPEGADGTLWEHLGDVYYKQNKTDKAVEYWKKAKEKGADNDALIDKKIQERKLYE